MSSDPFKQAAENATIAATYYNHLTQHGVPDTVAIPLTQYYIAGLQTLALEIYKMSQAPKINATYTEDTLQRLRDIGIIK